MDETPPSPALLELHQSASLFSLNIVEISASRADEELTPEDPTFSLEVAASEDGERFRLILTVKVVVEAGSVSIGVSGEFERNDYAGEIETPLLVEYANHVGNMILIPHLRSALSDVSLRVFAHPIVMPIFQRGQIWFPTA